MLLLTAAMPAGNDTCRMAKCTAAPGRVDTVTISPVNIQAPYTFNISLPASYIADDDTTRYPVVFLLNGHGGNQNSWGGIVPLDSIASAYSIIIVTPHGRNTWYWDSPRDPKVKMETFITDELIPYIDSNYRTIPAPESRAITGFSMGGHGALWLAIRHPELFANAGASSGGVDFTPFPGRWNIPTALGALDENRELWESHTVMSQLDALQQCEQPLNIIFDCGTEDFFYDVNCALDSALNYRHIHHTYITGPGKHNGEYWTRALYPQLDFFNRHLRR